MARPAPSTDNLVWCDLEMTGLDTNIHRIVEMACIITDKDLNILAESQNIVITHPQGVLDNMNDWCKQEFGKPGGLLEEIRRSTITTAQAEQAMIDFISPYVCKNVDRDGQEWGGCVLAGNTIHMDKRFLDVEMPRFMAKLHYRLIDVSTVKELCARWYPTEFKAAPKKAGAHRALDDIRESIKELKYYRSAVFKAPQ